ncbi:MAG TPA: hypothetical protein VFH51_13545, partial [Myxococcota bacterium]|nr:hypothetical protein [Myxococcota bacterium]
EHFYVHSLYHAGTQAVALPPTIAVGEGKPAVSLAPDGDQWLAASVDYFGSSSDVFLGGPLEAWRRLPGVPQEPLSGPLWSDHVVIVPTANHASVYARHSEPQRLFQYDSAFAPLGLQNGGFMLNVETGVRFLSASGQLLGNVDFPPACALSALHQAEQPNGRIVTTMRRQDTMYPFYVVDSAKYYEP